MNLIIIPLNLIIKPLNLIIKPLNLIIKPLTLIIKNSNLIMQPLNLLIELNYQCWVFILSVLLTLYKFVYWKKSILVSIFKIQCNSSNCILHKPICMCMVGINGLNKPRFIDDNGSSIALLMLSNLIPAPQIAYTSLLVCRCTFVIISLIIYNYPATLSCSNKWYHTDHYGSQNQTKI